MVPLSLEVDSTLVFGSRLCFIADLCARRRCISMSPDVNYHVRHTRGVPKLCALHRARERETCNMFTICSTPMDLSYNSFPLQSLF